MQKIGIHNQYTDFNKNNSLFDNTKYTLGQDMAYPFILLKEELSKLDIELCTIDMYNIDQFKIIIFLDLSTEIIQFIKKFTSFDIKFYLVIFESEIISPINWKTENHKYFSKIFTWNDDYVDNKKYFKFFWPNKIDKNWSDGDKKFACMIASNKYVNKENELYTERFKVIKWFEKCHNDEFNLYGQGWENGFIINIYFRFLNGTFLSRIFNSNLTTYKGRIASKSEVLSQFKFCFCFENALNIQGYVTEKIIDCLNSGSIPIYLGAQNITNEIPNNVFIDYSRFSSLQQLYYYLKNMNEKEYTNYLSNIEQFILKSQNGPYSAENFVSLVVKELSEELKL